MDYYERIQYFFVTTCNGEWWDCWIALSGRDIFLFALFSSVGCVSGLISCDTLLCSKQIQVFEFYFCEAYIEIYWPNWTTKIHSDPLYSRRQFRTFPLRFIVILPVLKLTWYINQQTKIAFFNTNEEWMYAKCLHFCMSAQNSNRIQITKKNGKRNKNTICKWSNWYTNKLCHENKYNKLNINKTEKLYENKNLGALRISICSCGMCAEAEME